MTRAICVIPARGGSVRIPRKNIRDFRGKPMIVWAIEAAQDAGVFARIIVSTDDDEIEKTARAYGCDTLRRDPDDGARGTQEVVADVLLTYSTISVCTLYPCSPLLDPGDLVESELFLFDGIRHVASCYWGESRDAGCFYWQDAQALLSGERLFEAATLMYPLAPGRAIDINTPEDWARAEELFDALRRAS